VALSSPGGVIFTLPEISAIYRGFHLKLFGPAEKSPI
jgi:hypothetical protein